jgi:hypothetical protein
MTKDRKDNNSKPWSSPPKKKKAEPKSGTEPKPIIVEDLTNILPDDESVLSRNLGFEAAAASVDTGMYASPNRSASTDRMANHGSNPRTDVRGANEEQPIWVSEEEDESIRAIRGERRPRGETTPSVSSSQPSSTRSPSAASRGSSRTSKTSSRSQKSSVDMSALKEDPSLEKELEEIALHSRAGMISGTPGAYDLEKGKNKKPAPHAARRYVEDEADKSWHTPLSMNETNNKTRNRKRLILILCMLGLLVLTGGLLYSFLGNGKTSQDNITDEEPATLTDRQQVMHSILIKVTSPSVLSDPTSSQYAARRWLLFRDSEIVELNEERIVQRYALACFYFSTGGEDSWEKINNNWLSGNECGDDVWDGIDCNAKGEVRALAFGK